MTTGEILSLIGVSLTFTTALSGALLGVWRQNKNSRADIWIELKRLDKEMGILNGEFQATVKELEHLKSQINKMPDQMYLNDEFRKFEERLDKKFDLWAKHIAEIVRLSVNK